MIEIIGIIIGIVGLTLALFHPEVRRFLRLEKREKPVEDQTITEPPITDQIWNVPLPRNPNFTGRESLLKELRDSLCSGEHTALTQAISGLGGVGKTQLALEYAYLHKVDYQVIWWIRSEDTAKLGIDYGDLAVCLKLAKKEDTDQPTLVKMTRNWLEQRKDWLLIFDNVGKPEDLKDYQPTGARGHVIITSRHPDWKDVASPLSVRVFDRDESIEFLLNRTGQDDRDSANSLAQELGDLPLALAQAASYIEQTGRTLSDYLSLFKEHQREILKRGKASPDYPETVATTWELAFDEVKKTPGAAELLNLCAFLAPDDIPKDLITNGAEHLPKNLAKVVSDELKFDEAIKTLRRYSLAEVSGESLSVHRLVQAVVRDKLSKKEQKIWVEAAIKLVYKEFPASEHDYVIWPRGERIVPHVRASAEQAKKLTVALETTMRALNAAGYYVKNKLANYPEAKALYERALKIDEKAFGPDHPNVAIRVNNLGSVLNDMGDLQGAKEHYQRALKIFIKFLGEDHPKTQLVRENLESLRK